MVGNPSIRVVVFQQGPWWVGQCLEYDIAAQAKTLQALYGEVERVIVGRLIVAQEHGVPAFRGLPEAPARFWRMFDEATLALQRHQRSLDVPPNIWGLVPWPEVRIAEPTPA
jgi:hypothetical protein